MIAEPSLGKVHPRSLKHLYHNLHHLVAGKLWIKVFLGMFAGAFVGFLLGPDANLFSRVQSQAIGEWLALPGTIFIKGIQMIVIPLIFASIIRGIASSESMKHLKRSGMIAGLYFLITTLLAVGIGLLFSFAVKPGAYMQDIGNLEAETVPFGQMSLPTADNIPQMISQLLPVSIFGSILKGDMLQIVIFSIIMGITLVYMNAKQSKPLLELLGAIQNVCMTIVKWIMLLAPLAVFGLIAKLVSQFGIHTLLGIGVYVLTVLAGLLTILGMYFIIVYSVAGITPARFLAGSSETLLLAFSTSSSAAVMPLTMKTAEEKFSIRPSISQFVVPIGATVNMNGTALYQTVSVIFLAQVFGVSLSIHAILLLVFTIVAASIGSPAAPGVGTAILTVILESVGIPIAGLALILGVERVLDMCRTTVNVAGDLTACTVVDSMVKSKKSAQQMENEENKREVDRKINNQDVIISAMAR